MAVALSMAALALAGCTTVGATEGPAPAPEDPALPARGAAPDSCLPAPRAARGSIEGTPVWARFCPGPRGRTSPAEVPAEALTTHLELLAGLVPLSEEVTQAEARCERSWGRTYRLQIGYDDGHVATVAGRTDPGCAGRLPAIGARVGGPDGLGVYGLVMAAFGRQAADGFDDAASDVPLVGPKDPRRPDSVDRDGPSVASTAGYLFGERTPMTMPLSARRGIVCTWPYGGEDDAPEIRVLSAEEAERVRIGLHAIDLSMVDCVGSREPTSTAVVEDRTGTRRAITVIDSACSSVIRSDDGYGTGFAWLDR